MNQLFEAPFDIELVQAAIETALSIQYDPDQDSEKDRLNAADYFIGAIETVYCELTGMTSGEDPSTYKISDDNKANFLQKIEILSKILSRESFRTLKETMRILRVEDETKLMLSVIGLYLDSLKLEG
jgi:hypothetical protein